MTRFLCLGFILSGVLPAQEAGCARYPASAHEADRIRFRAEREFVEYATRARAAKRQDARMALSARAATRNNFIDDHLFGRMEADGIEPAPAATDVEFQRRVRLDLTGRIAEPAEAREFLDDTDPDKRRKLIAKLMGSTAFIDHFTQWYADQFQVTSGYYNIVPIEARNGFYRFVRDFVERDRPYDEFIRDMLTATGINHETPAVGFLVRGLQIGDPVQDTWDALADRITVKFLGHKTECVSCHNGRPNLNNINLYLYGRRRDDFFKQSAFLARTYLTTQAFDPYGNSQRTVVTDRPTGAYYGAVNLNNPGQRPFREGGPYTPVFFFTGEKPQSEDWRSELARLVTSQRQFARAAVNYLWAKIFTVGLVDPPESWDLARIDPYNPPPSPWVLQLNHAALMDALADEFIRSGYNVRRMVQLMVESNAYQLSARHPAYNPNLDKYYARKIPRRLTAEEIYDATAVATDTLAPMWVDGFNEPLLYAGQLPDPTEPRRDSTISAFLAQFGRGDWWTSPRSSQSAILQVLFLMNDSNVNYRASGTLGGNRNSRVAQLVRSGVGDEDAVRTLFMATLSRPPSDEEMRVTLARRVNNRETWLSDVQWALLNKLDFLFNY